MHFIFKKTINEINFNNSCKKKNRTDELTQVTVSNKDVATGVETRVFFTKWSRLIPNMHSEINKY